MSARTEELHDQPVFWRELPCDGAPPLYLHGVPNSSDIWAPFIERSGGIAVDLPGFGRSGKRADLAYDMEFYDAWLEDFLQWRGIDEVKLVVHDWGGVGLLWAQRFPERVRRLVIIDSIPLLPGFRPPLYARALRAPLIGECLVATWSTWLLKPILRGANVKPLPRSFYEPVHRQLDQGTQRAILRLYRSVRPGELELAGRRLEEIECPALVVWGEQDPYVGAGYADFYADELGGDARAWRVEQAGHWPWLDRPEVVDEVCEFLSA